LPYHSLLRIPGSLILTVEHYQSPEACLALRQAYEDGLRRNCFAPRGMASTDIALSRVTSDELAARLYLDVAERIRWHFALPPLFIDYCAYTRIRPGGSHPLHADAVALDGTPNHTPHRIASAMLYLSDSEIDFEGGTLRFPKLGIEVLPRIGLLVGFLTNLEYQHEVPPVTAGVRDAVAMWFQLASGRP
jgi:predicted 2-oxoglutarate/Fe(II)-dependent dioxygenase YbiX